MFILIPETSEEAQRRFVQRRAGLHVFAPKDAGGLP